MNNQLGKTFAAGMIVLAAAGCDDRPDSHNVRQPESQSMRLQIPESISHEHQELHEVLGQAAKESGEMGAAAKGLEEVLGPHFRREEEIATPPLGLLPALAQGNATQDMRVVLPLTEALEREMPQMLREHDAIRQALGRFRAAAEAAGQQRYIEFADHLAAHARQEEEILYPAAVLVGRYVARTAPEQ